MKRILPFIIATSALAQTPTTLDLGKQGKNIDFSASSLTKPIRSASSLPGTCSPFELIYLTSATAGQNLYACTATNTWTAQAGGGGGSTTNGSNGQALISNGSGGFGSAVSLAPSATTDTTNASNITSGTLAAARVATLNQSTTGNAATATALASAPTKCSATSYTIGVDAAGNAQSCTALSTVATSGNYTDLNGKPSFSASATTDATNASNITSGTLSTARLPNPMCSGTGCPSVTPGTGGGLAGPEGTAPSAGPASSVCVEYFDSASNRPLVNCNNAGYLPLASLGQTTAHNASYTVLTQDAANILTTNATATYTLPQAGTTGFPQGWWMTACNVSTDDAQILTLSTSTSVFYGGLPSSGATVNIPFGSCANVQSNGTNYLFMPLPGFSSNRLDVADGPLQLYRYSSGTYPLTCSGAGIACYASANFSILFGPYNNNAYGGGPYTALRRSSANTFQIDDNAGTIGSIAAKQTQPYNLISFAATPNFDLSKGDQAIILTSNITSFTVSSMAAGQKVVFEICQDGTGSRTISGIPTNVHGMGTVGASANTCSIQQFESFDGNNLYALGPMVINQ